MGKGHNFTGMCHSARSRHDRALDHYLRALEHFERSGDRWYIAMAHNNIGAVHEKLGDHAKAGHEYGTALHLFGVLADTVWVANVSNNLGNLHYEAGRHDSAVTYYHRANTVLTAAGMDLFAASARMNLANALGRTDQAERALEVMRSARTAMPAGEDDQTRANILAHLGRMHGEAGRPDSAAALLRQALSLAVATRSLDVQANAHQFLSAHHERMGRMDSALAHHKRWAVLHDSIFNAEHSVRIAEMQEKYESDRKDLLLAEHRARAERRALIMRAVAAGAVLLLIAALSAFAAYRTKRRSEAALARKNARIGVQLKEKELLLREIHHRVKNNLQTVSSLLSIQGRAITDEKAKQAVNDGRLRVKSMALIHQDLYREGDLTGVRMPAYVHKLAHSLIASYASADRVRLESEVADIVLDVDTAVPIGLVLNELVTNALKYAWPGERSGVLRIVLRPHGDALELAVADDGVGMPPDGAAQGTGFGLDMVRTFAGKLKAEWAVHNGPGTTVRMTIRKFKRADG